MRQKNCLSVMGRERESGMLKPPLDITSRFDRGGRPSVREMLADLVFSPADGTIRFRESRLIMQRAAVNFRLRKEVINALGPAEARIFLMRLGFQSGRDDARFVRTSWPNLDTGDAFTAGTRLHMFGGVVQVETVHNDFDFRKKRFSGEFLWHDSVEASDPRLQTPHSVDPVCWTQVGYASGYASEFFDTLIVYKELSCSAQGHKACRVIGKPADLWGHDDPDVVVFRERIAPITASVRARAPHDAPATHRHSAVLAQVQRQLDTAASHDLPLLFSGPCGSGRLAAANYLHDIARAEGQGPIHISAATLSPDALVQVMEPRPRPSRKGAAPPVFILDRIEALLPATQDRLIALLRSPQASLMPRLIAFSSMTPGQLRQDDRLQDALSYRLLVNPIAFSAFSERRSEIPEIATDILAVLANRLGQAAPILTDTAQSYLGAHHWPGNLHELESVLLSCLLAHPAEPEITATMLRNHHSPRTIQGPNGSKDPRFLAWLLDTMQGGGVSLPDIEAQIYTAALSQADGNLAGAARLIGLTRAQLAYRIKQVDD